MSFEMFYITQCPPGKAEGSDDWNVYPSYADEEKMFDDEGLDYMDEEYDEEGNLRPLDYFFPRD